MFFCLNKTRRKKGEAMMNKLNAYFNTEKLTNMFENANDDLTQINYMINNFNKLYPIFKLDVNVSYNTDKMKKYVEIEEINVK